MNAIITAATGYKAADLQIFLWSVEKNCKDTLVFLIAYRRDRKIIEQLRSQYPFVRPVYISAVMRHKVFPTLNRNRIRPYYSYLTRYLSKTNYSSTHPILRSLGQLSIQIIHERFFIALKILQAHRNSLSNVLLTDCRDVVIQGNPFELIDGKLVSGLEPGIIRNEKYTTNWIRGIYGDNFLHKISDFPVVCAGVTIGTVQKVEDYLIKLCDEMWRHLPKMAFETWGYDQGAHIYLIAEQQLSLDLTTNDQGFIATVSLENPSNFFIDFAREQVKVFDKYPAIIHQYDRHPDLLNFFKEAATTEPSIR